MTKKIDTTKFKLKERIAFDGFVHKSFLNHKILKELKRLDEPLAIHFKKENKYYKRVLVIES